MTAKKIQGETIKQKIAADLQEQQRIKRLIHFRMKYIAKSVNKAAQLLEVAQPVLWYAENGERQISLELLERFYDKFSMSSEWFMYGTGPELQKEVKKKNSIDVINELRAEVSTLEKKIKICEINQLKTFDLIVELQKRLDKAGI